MRLMLRTLLISCLTLIAGCVAFIPIAEYMPATPDGVVHTSNCIGEKSVRYDFDGVPMHVHLLGSATPKLVMGLTLAKGRVARFPVAEIRITPLTNLPTLTSFTPSSIKADDIRPLPNWDRYVLRRIKPNSNRLERVVIESAPAAGPIIGGMPIDGESVLGRFSAKSFSVTLTLDDTPAEGFIVQLPAIDINGKRYTIAPITYRHQRRMEFIVPINC